MAGEIADPASNAADVFLLDTALRKLEAFDATQGRIVELRFFGGLTIEETADLLGLSPMTIKRDWAVAKAWLYRRLKSRPAPRSASPPAPGERSR